MKKPKIVLFLLILSLQSFPQNLDDSLLLHYQFDGNILDMSGNGFDGTPFGIQFGNDRFGNENAACYFDGIDDYVNFPNLDELKPSLPVSFSFWIKYNGTDASDRVVFNTSFEEDINSGIFFTSQSSTGKYAIGYGDGSDFYSSSSIRNYISNTVIDTNKWHHIVVTLVSESNMKIYVGTVEADGKYGGSGGELAYSPSPGCLGRHDQNVIIPAYYFKGAIDDFRYWNRELSLSEINELNNGLVTSSKGSETLTNVLSINPNPAKEILHIEAHNNDFENLFIYNSMGQLVYQSEFRNQIRLENFSPGLFFLLAQRKLYGAPEIVKFMKK